MNLLKLKLVILACVIMNTANSFTNTDNTKKNNKESVKIENTVSDKSESDNDDVKEESILNTKENKRVLQNINTLDWYYDNTNNNNNLNKE